MEGHRAKPFRRHKKYVGKDLELEFRNLVNSFWNNQPYLDIRGL